MRPDPGLVWPRWSRVPGVSLLAPGVAVHVVAERFPEARLVRWHVAQLAHPFGAFPEIEVGHEEARRSAVFRRERRALIYEGDHALSLREIGDGHVRGVAAVAHRHDIPS